MTLNVSFDAGRGGNEGSFFYYKKYNSISSYCCFLAAGKPLKSSLMCMKCCKLENRKRETIFSSFKRRAQLKVNYFHFLENILRLSLLLLDQLGLFCCVLFKIYLFDFI